MKLYPRFFALAKSVWEKTSLKRKSSIILIVGITIPTIAITMILLNSLNQSETAKIKEDSKRNLEIVSMAIMNNIQLAHTSTLLVKSNRAIAEFLSNTEPSVQDIYEFHRIYTNNIQSIVNTNTKLSSIRIYYNNPKIPEMWPVFYKYDRISNANWFKKLSLNNTYIVYDYTENLAKYSGYVPQKGLVSFFTKIAIDRNNDAIVEVSFRMEDFFDQLYTVSSTNVVAFAENGHVFYDSENENARMWNDVLYKVNEKININDLENNEEIFTINKEKYLVSYSKTKLLDGHLFEIVSLAKSLGNIGNTQVSLLFSMLIILFISWVFVNRVISLLLKRLYKVVDAMRELGRGNFDIEVSNTESDELSKLEYYFNRMARQMNILVEQNTKRAIMEKDAQIRALQNQINSHFLYNTLESIKMMAELANQYGVADAITSLAKLLRYTMAWKNQTVKLYEEIEYVKNYLKIINLRFDHVINLAIELIPELTELEMPKMTIQPIIENAIIHGIEKMDSDATIYIKTTISDNDITISITDNGIGMSEEEVCLLNEKIKGNRISTGNTTGIGLRNVQERLELLFGKGYGLRVVSSIGVYTKVIVMIPLHRQR